ncbi:MAG: response regulator, partial [Oscillospiraceae bacterium]
MGKKIMLVDDAAFMRMMIRNMLTQGGYTDIIEAENGLVAVEMYKSEKPDLVIMDITMPEKDGIAALREIKEYDSSSNVVMCSALGQEKLVLDALKSGAADFIVKPFKPERIMD